jgi:hypothetical protein
MAEQKVPIPGVPVEASEEQLKAEKQRMVDERLKIIDQLNQIKLPLQVTVFSPQGPWTIRNVEFWKFLQQKDEQVTKYMEEYLAKEGT